MTNLETRERCKKGGGQHPTSRTHFGLIKQEVQSSCQLSVSLATSFEGRHRSLQRLARQVPSQILHVNQTKFSAIISFIQSLCVILKYTQRKGFVKPSVTISSGSPQWVTLSIQPQQYRLVKQAQERYLLGHQIH
ncbi:hypothetical protein FGO68_gene483 [Halteria grandinella]|uniref:Uncharacterized protein n=1 Tax=Halteria grandinella TaxID=5974 RepID=A0A8J8NSF9_HALGN|nr:hypothetical protein FGO68_gene483 [Halteria grandinella]